MNQAGGTCTGFPCLGMSCHSWFSRHSSPDPNLAPPSSLAMTELPPLKTWFSRHLIPARHAHKADHISRFFHSATPLRVFIISWTGLPTFFSGVDSWSGWAVVEARSSWAPGLHFIHFLLFAFLDVLSAQRFLVFHLQFFSLSYGWSKAQHNATCAKHSSFYSRHTWNLMRTPFHDTVSVSKSQCRRKPGKLHFLWKY